MEWHRRPFTRFAALSLAVGGHVLLLLLFWASRAPTIRTTAPAARSVLLLLEAPKPPESPGSVAAESSANEPAPEREHIEDKREVDAAIHPRAPSIDWRAEARRAAGELAPEWFEQLQQKCRDAQPGAPPPPGCERSQHDFEWNPEPGRVGVDGLLPFVRIGKRCVVGLGFFGCGMGKLPEPNGDLFEDMRNPDRPRSSVPEE